VLLGLALLFLILFCVIGRLTEIVRAAVEASEKFRRGSLEDARFHPIDLIDRWAKGEGVRIDELERVNLRWHRIGQVSGRLSYRLLVTDADGRGRYVTVSCGHRIDGVPSDIVEAVWDDAGIPLASEKPWGHSLWDEEMDNLPAA
jgi:hypothetical protein